MAGATAPRAVQGGNMARYHDPYMAKCETVKEAGLRKAFQQMIRAARLALEAKHALEYAKNHLEMYYGERVEKNPTKSLPAWVYGCIDGALNEGSLDEVADWLFVDADPKRAAMSLALLKATERRDRAVFARKARKPAVKVVEIPRPVAVAA